MWKSLEAVVVLRTENNKLLVYPINSESKAGGFFSLYGNKTWLSFNRFFRYSNIFFENIWCCISEGEGCALFLTAHGPICHKSTKKKVVIKNLLFL